MSEIPQADQEGELCHPRHVYDYFGQDAIEAELADAISTNRLHHAWMITGAKGVGKASLAYRIARRVLGAKPGEGRSLSSNPDDPVCHQIEALSHPDFLLLRRPYDEKTKKLKNVLTVDEVRRAPDFFSRSASGQGWRVVIVDCADDMNTNAANALLKTLEEPPKRGLLLLVVHAPGRLPRTIRSRCRVLNVRAPGIDETAHWLQSHHGLASDDAQAVSELAQGAPGRALMLAQTHAPEIKTQLDSLLEGLPRLNRTLLHDMCTKLARKGQEGLRAITLDFILDYAEDQARTQARGSRLAVAGLWAQCKDEVSALIRESEGLYLDPKQTLLAAFALLENYALKATKTV